MREMSTTTTPAGNLPGQSMPGLSAEAWAFIVESLSPSTRRNYAAQLKLWLAYAEAQALPAFPAAPATVASWLAQRATSGIAGGRRAKAGRAGQSISTLRVAIAALKAAHDAQGLEFDSGDVAIRRLMQGISRVRAEPAQQVAPLEVDLLLQILVGLGSSPIDIRDGALLALGYIFARRRSELAGLDLDVQGEGSAILERDATHIVIRLVRSKTGENLDPIYVPRATNRAAVNAIERWLEHAKIEQGTPVLRGVEKGGNVRDHRMNANSIGAIIQRRIVKHLVAGGVPPDIAEREALRYSGHSLRHGFASTAAVAGANPIAIGTVTGHRSMSILARYVRQADAKKVSPHNLPGVGLGQSEDAPRD